MLLMKESWLSLKEKKTRHWFPTFKLPESTNTLYYSPVNIYLGRFRYTITKLYDWIQLFVYYTRALVGTLWLSSTDEYVTFWFWAKVHLQKYIETEVVLSWGKRSVHMSRGRNLRKYTPQGYDTSSLCSK